MKGVKEPVINPVDYEVKLVGSRWELTLRLDHKWLTDKKTVYPVIVDPTIGGDSINAYKSNGVHVAGTVQVGNTRESNTNKYWRTVLHWDYSGAAGKQITGAYISTSCRACSAGTYTSNVYNASCFGYSCAYAYMTSINIGTGLDDECKFRRRICYRPRRRGLGWRVG